MAEFKVAERFISINGEGTRAGQLAVFIRFVGCNLCCPYCDTKWANASDAPYIEMTAEEIYAYIKATGISNVTLTGGEPLFRDGINELAALLSGDTSLYTEIETNGAVDVGGIIACGLNRPSLTLDYKLPTSKMEGHMLRRNFELIGKGDTVKFVVGSDTDLERALEVINEHKLTEKCSVYFSPVFGAIEPKKIVEFMIKNKLNGVNMQLQMHKFIWEPDRRGV